jgi:hypothetical protein
MYTFHIQIMGSTEAPSSQETRVRAYLVRCYEYGKKNNSKTWSERRAVVSGIWSLQSSYERQIASDPTITIDKVRAVHEQDGYIFFATEAEAKAAAADMVQRFEFLLDEVYGPIPSLPVVQDKAIA